jgi:hypothetical protein
LKDSWRFDGPEGSWVLDVNSDAKCTKAYQKSNRRTKTTRRLRNFTITGGKWAYLYEPKQSGELLNSFFTAISSSIEI